MTMPASLSTAQLRDRVEKLPRVRLGQFPTPLEFCPRLTECLGGPRVYIKRDDCTGLAFGGNKTRQLEFTVAQGLHAGADILVGGAGSQSNHCRQLAAAAARNGLDCALVVTKDHKHHPVRGNLLLDDLLGATVQMVEVDSPEFLDEAKSNLMRRLKEQGRKPFLVMQTANRPFGGMGYALCMAEISDQLREQKVAIDTLVVCSAGTTQPGLMFANKVLGLGIRIIGIAPIVWSYDLKDAFLRILDRMAALLDLKVSFCADEIINLDGYVGPRGYGRPTPEGNRALRLLARQEGVLLDPIYSAKALAGLIDLVEKGKIGAGQSVLFLHTGGTPALFAYEDELLSDL